MKKELEARGGLKACSEVIDFENMKREMDAYFSKKLEESGLEVCFSFCFCFCLCFVDALLISWLVRFYMGERVKNGQE